MSNTFLPVLEKMYKISIKEEPFNVSDYREVLITELTDNGNFYVNPNATFSLGLKFPPLEIKVKKKKNKWDPKVEEVEEVEETEAAKIYRVEYNSYAERKNQQMPLWKLHLSSVQKIIDAVGENAIII